MSLRTVDKVGRVLDLFSFERVEWGVSEVAEALGLPKSGAHALMSSLAKQGLLRRTKKGRYMLGWNLLRLSEVLMGTADFRLQARPAMEHLASRFGEVVHLAALERGRVVYIEKIWGHRALLIPITGRGLTLPAHCSSVGKVLLAHRPWEEVLQILDDRGIPALTPNTVTSPDDLDRELEGVRERGYAFDREETMLNLSCVAAPIRDRTGEVVASMSFSVPAYRFEQGEERYRTVIVETSRNVSEDIGYTE